MPSLSNPTDHRGLPILLLIALSLIGLSSPPPSAAAEPPNIVLIAIDDLNDWVGCLDGHPQAKTPNIDRLAARGTLFTNAHCQAPICGPSRASLLSGRYPHTTGVYQQPGRQGLKEDQKFFRGHLLPEYFAKHGYQTLATGKITHGYPPKTAFQETGVKGSSGPKPPQGKRFNYHLPDVPWTGTQTDWGAFPDDDGLMPDHQSADWAIGRIGDELPAPFFLAVGFVRPHVPFYVPQKWFDQFPLDQIQLPAVKLDDLDDVPATGVAVHELPKYPKLAFLQADGAQQFKLCVQAYLACIAFVDHQVGRVVDAVDRSPHKDNTIVILFSDHGYHIGEKDRVSKHSLWEESTRVPLIVAGPGLPAGKICDQPAGLIDLYPTLVELAGLPARVENEGRSLVPLMRGEAPEWRHSILTSYGRGNHSLRSLDHRYIRYGDGSEELYDLKQDPHGWVNLAGEDSSRGLIRRFRKELPGEGARYHPSTSPAPINAWFKEHLEKNGVTGSRK